MRSVGMRVAWLGAASALFALALLAGGCGMAGEGEGEGSDFEEFAGGGFQTGSATLGKADYDRYCAGCHGADPAANALDVGNGNNAAAIGEAIDRNTGGMGSLAFLTAGRLDDIAAYIRLRVAGLGTSGSTTPLPGDALYADMCAGCHGADPANGRNRIALGTSAAAILGMHNFVSASEAASIAAYIAERLSGNTGTGTGGTPTQPAQTLIPWDAAWAYLDDGTDPGADWTQPAYDDSAWPRGPAELGYGDGDEATVLGYGPDAGNKYITYYFRHTLPVADPAAVAVLTGNLKYDDGAVLYLNGQEVGRFNMPDGPIGPDTLAASSHEATDTFDIPVGLLRSGDNLFAVEIHQNIANSFDISFAFNLDAVPAP
jgi:mono/diheme cytochrome c family protein